MDAWRPPAVLGCHPLNEYANLAVSAWTTRFWRLPPPEGHEAFPVPSRDRLGFHHNEGVGLLAPEAAQCDPEQAITVVQVQSGVSLLEYCQLLAQCCILNRQMKLRTKQGANSMTDRRESSEHPRFYRMACSHVLSPQNRGRSNIGEGHPS
jgi:hypothetical protein